MHLLQPLGPACSGGSPDGEHCRGRSGFGEGLQPKRILSVGQRLPVLVSTCLGSAEKPCSAEVSLPPQQGAAARLGEQWGRGRQV